ncbi:polypeptide N-acetylgalactosaminyltransferase 11 [Caerostris extrusa]|uniref:Polypeptide N-acetylgalactosaminyltransferase 11 n=1 Tax=Caerostris extrusa TaxID=172846 RepID=A0AAV4XLP2_CAEEX|nr:polypeptide N-acetylgalactosaminyltransferase 11 [Caerostris extrusa]
MALIELQNGDSGQESTTCIVLHKWMHYLFESKEQRLKGNFIIKKDLLDKETNLIDQNDFDYDFKESKTSVKYEKLNNENKKLLNSTDLVHLGMIYSPVDQRIKDEGYKKHAFNLLISDRLGYRRAIPYTAHSLCKNQVYSSDLPKASIIICFYNEAWSTLIRMIYSVIDRTPTHLLHEIILVDDCSDDVVCPIIDIINADTFEYISSPIVRGGFNWGLHFKWDSVHPNQLRTKEDFIKPIESPTMAGGLFAINKNYFHKLGEYDQGMDIWGGENLEISFFERRRPYGSPEGEDTLTYNSLRVAHVWMDEYIENFF